MGFLKVLTVLRAAVLLSLGVASAVSAGDRQFLGWGGSFNNDLFGDGKDRWRTSSYTTSILYGPEWQGALPYGFGDLLEVRLNSTIISPEDIQTPEPGDRRFAGTYELTLHTHLQRGGYEFALGGGLSVTGSQTGHDTYQREVHRALGVTVPSNEMFDDQIGNRFYPTLVAEVMRPVPIVPGMTARPFAEARSGVETLLRAGGDLIFGTWGEGDLIVRDATTGQFYTATKGGAAGTSFILGGDLAWVADSYYLPSSDGYELTDTRARLRAGVKWQGARYGLFYGVTWMGKEFEGQDESQVVGTLNLRIGF